MPGETEDSCGQCRATGLELLLCRRCLSVSYCSPECQKLAWKTHKKVCKLIDDGANWDVLSPLQRRRLRAHHLSFGCTDPWPLVRAEVPEMLQPPFPSFLCMHPNQRFKVVIEQLPGFIIEMPGADVDGKDFPAGQPQPVLTENFAAVLSGLGVTDPCKHDMQARHANMSAYLARVPAHGPMPSTYAVLGEVVWTKECQRELAAFYDHGGSGGDGKFFRWPGGDAIGTCPGTGAPVKTDGRTRHLLVACEMQGVKELGEELHEATRILPRVLTREGYMRMVGEEGPHCSCVVTRRSLSTGAFLREETVPFFPLGLHRFSLWGEKAVPASKGWAIWHAHGNYAAYERLREDKRRELPTTGHDGELILVEGRSSGPSTYLPQPQARNASGSFDPSLIAPGTPLRIKGLVSRADLNGRHATALQWDAEAQRLGVIVSGSQARIKLKSSNFELNQGFRC